VWVTDQVSTELVEAPAGDILVVDDNPNNLIAIEAALGGMADRLIKAQSGVEALRHLLNRDFALIILDVQMPAMDGFETARMIRSRDRSRDTPIIFITAFDRDDREVLSAYELGAVDFLFKPIVAEILRAKASVFVSLKRRTEEVAKQALMLREHERREHERRIAEERRRWEAEALRRRMEEERANAEVLSRKAEELARIVAEKERIERELKRMNYQLAEADKKKDEFLAMLGHELRNPLTPLTTGLEVLKMQRIEDPVFMRIRDMMERQVRQLARLVDDLLDISRITSGKIDLRTEPVDLTEIVRQVAETSRPILTERKQRLVLEVPNELIHVRGDPARLTQVVSNLLQNAIRYTDAGGRIALSCYSDGGNAVLRVADNGRGIPPELLTRIFDMFVQHTPTNDGLGLGLTLVKQLVDLHGGHVTAESQGENRGSTFTVRLPIAQVDAATPIGSRDAFRAATSSRLEVVVIEDNRDAREALSELLESLGHEVHHAPDGPSGLDLVLRVHPDVALVDIGLPGLDGYGVAERVRARLANGGPRLVALTGFGQESDRKRALAAGFDAHLPKPPSLQSLLRVLEGEQS
jgi:signal transduction histidine kinase